MAFIFLSPCFGKSQVQSYFNHRAEKTYVDPYYGRSRPGDNLEDVLLAAIKNSKQSLDVAVYQLDLPLVAKALVSKSKEGVIVRVILDNTNSKAHKDLSEAEIAQLPEHEKTGYLDFLAFADEDHNQHLSQEELEKNDSMTILNKGGVNWIDDTADGSKGSGLMHHKFMIVDGKEVITGSANFTRSCIHGDALKKNSIGNANSLLDIQSPEVANLFTEEFNEMWVKKKFGLKKKYRGPQHLNLNGIDFQIQFSPTSKTKGYEASTNGLISREIEAGQGPAHFALFVFSEQKLVDSMDRARAHGLIPNVLIDPSFATRDYSELLDIWGLQMPNGKCQYETDNHIWSPSLKNSGFTNLADGDVLHHKFGVINSHTVIVGSHNWSAAANNLNDEALMIFKDDALGADYDREFNLLYKDSIIGPQPWLLKKIDTLEKNCQIH